MHTTDNALEDEFVLFEVVAGLSIMTTHALHRISPKSPAATQLSCKCFLTVHVNPGKKMLQDSVGKVLESIVELRRDGVDGLLDKGVDQRVQLVLGQVDVEASAHALHGGRAGRKAGQLGT